MCKMSTPSLFFLKFFLFIPLLSRFSIHEVDGSSVTTTLTDPYKISLTSIRVSVCPQNTVLGISFSSMSMRGFFKGGTVVLVSETDTFNIGDCGVVVILVDLKVLVCVFCVYVPKL